MIDFFIAPWLFIAFLQQDNTRDTKQLALVNSTNSDLVINWVNRQQTIIAPKTGLIILSNEYSELFWYTLKNKQYITEGSDRYDDDVRLIYFSEYIENKKRKSEVRFFKIENQTLAMHKLSLPPGIQNRKRAKTHPIS